MVLKTRTVRSCFYLGPCLDSELFCFSPLLTLLPLSRLRIVSVLASRQRRENFTENQGFSASLKTVLLASLGKLGKVKSGSLPRGRLMCMSRGCQSLGASICKIFTKASGSACRIRFIFHTPAAKALLPLQFSLCSGLSGEGLCVYLQRNRLTCFTAPGTNQKEREVT